jgi:hypothetical protein
MVLTIFSILGSIRGYWDTRIMGQYITILLMLRVRIPLRRGVLKTTLCDKDAISA